MAGSEVARCIRCGREPTREVKACTRCGCVAFTVGRPLDGWPLRYEDGDITFLFPKFQPYEPQLQIREDRTMQRPAHSATPGTRRLVVL